MSALRCSGECAANLSSHFPIASLGPVEPLVGFVIAQELFFGGIPLEAAMVPIREVAQMADGHGAATDLDIANGALAAMDAILPVTHVVGGKIETRRVWGERFLEKFFIAR